MVRRATLSVVIPVYNESSRLPRTIETFKSWKRFPLEVIFVDDGSTDTTVSLIPDLPGWKVLRLGRHRGKGFAVRQGVLSARGDRILFTDADLATPLSQLPLFERVLDKGFDLAIASRALPTSRSESTQSRMRQLASSLFGNLSKLLLVCGVWDSQCGFKLFAAKTARALFSQCTSSTPLFDMEVLLLAGKHKLSVAEIASTWRHDPDSRLRYNLVSSIKVLGELLRLKWHHRVFWPVDVHAIQFEHVR